MSCSGNPRLLEAGWEKREDGNISARPSLALDTSLGFCQSQDTGLKRPLFWSSTAILTCICPFSSPTWWTGVSIEMFFWGKKKEVDLTHLVHGLYVFPDHLKGKCKASNCRRTEDCWRIWNYFLYRRKLQDKMTAVISDKILLSSQCFHTKEILKLKDPERILVVL